MKDGYLRQRALTQGSENLVINLDDQSFLTDTSPFYDAKQWNAHNVNYAKWFLSFGEPLFWPYKALKVHQRESFRHYCGKTTKTSLLNKISN